jgi:hypothetical protein
MGKVLNMPLREGERFKLGLIHDHRPPEVPNLATFATVKVPAPPPSMDLIKATRPMALNDRDGDCTIAGAAHVNQDGSLQVKQKWTYCGDTLTGKTYFGLTGGQDTGLMLPQVLKPWHLGQSSEGGLFLGENPNGGYAIVHPKNTTQVKQALWIFGNTYTAVDLPAIAQDQFRPDGSGVWELTGTQADYDIEGGHCIVGAAYNATGPICVTWGSTVQVTWEWWFTYVVQCYVVVPPAFVAHGGDGRGFDLTAIDTYLKKV